ncbi:endolytic transglycosylase MltG [Phenylobacterium sp.]|uniref:endolytic transglycosylase MltG n=1 Tax=Phenylobacterium sp. TaxID=1871053 RepID=UPI00286B1547|nr:endolytic transglycosylase MltG [Phenylobacterium sp.]
MSRRRPPVRRRRALPRTLSGGVVALFVAMTLVSGWAVWSYRGPGPTARSGSVTHMVLTRGSGAGQIATALRAAGVIRSRTLFLLAARLVSGHPSLKAGEYEFPSGVSMARVLADIQAGRVVRRFVAVPEGWTSDMAVEAVRAQPVLTGQVATPPEGSILPDSYQVEPGEDRAAVVARMRAARDALLAQLWAGRANDLPLNTPEQAVTLASLVEKETGLPAERPRIAAVFENRLRAGMKLESDPTVIYGVSKGRPLGRGITLRELLTATPYNTYRIIGLPPTPIANPGRAALAAVLNPPKSAELFFVADGTGGHVFASTYAEHQANVARWRGIERAKAGK